MNEQAYGFIENSQKPRDEQGISESIGMRFRDKTAGNFIESHDDDDDDDHDDDDDDDDARRNQTSRPRGAPSEEG